MKQVQHKISTHPIVTRIFLVNLHSTTAYKHSMAFMCSMGSMSRMARPMLLNNLFSSLFSILVSLTCTGSLTLTSKLTTHS